MKPLHFTGLALLSWVGFAAAEDVRIRVDTALPGVTVSPSLYGIFFEEINRAGDGGLYAEMIQNRSFEDGATLPIAWQLIKANDAKASAELDRSGALNANNPTSLRLDVESVGADGRVGVANLGFVGTPRNARESDDAYAARFDKAAADQKGHGIALKAGADYDLSLYTRGGLLVTATLETRDGKALASQELPAGGSTWQKRQCTLKPSADATDARLVVSVSKPGTVWLDMVSLFPKDTFKGRPNGLRKDLAERIAAMKPAFVRFPGGCFVEGDEIENAFRWKKTVGDVAERPGHWNLWGYRSTDGLGYHEYLQFCEDLGAEAMYVINVGMSHHAGRNNAYAVPMDQMQEYVQDALDAVEYAIGPVDSKWGAERAKAGHPAPFNLKYMEIGNENGGPAYHERYALFYDALKAKYPQIQLIANDWGGIPKNRKNDVVDEHYYNNPRFFIQQAEKYDTYDRAGHKVYVGEYAVTRECGLGNLSAALGEAAFMIGMERNSDVVTMASYAPLLAEPAWKRWNPNAINFDGSRVYGTPSYHLQAMFGNNRPDVTFSTTVQAVAVADDLPHGRFGVGTWDTQTEFKDIKVIGADGKTLWQFDPAKGTEQFQLAGGEWSVEDGVLKQSSSARPATAFAGDASWGDYTIELKARKTGGSEGFLISFHSQDPKTMTWWNLGGWQNRQHGLEAPDLPGTRVPGKIDADKWYDIKIELKGKNVRCYLDGKRVHDATAQNPNRVFATAGLDRKAGEYVVKLLNPTATAMDAAVTLAGVNGLAAEGTAIVLQSDSPADENSFDSPEKVAPRTTQLKLSGKTAEFKQPLPKHSITILRVKEQ